MFDIITLDIITQFNGQKQIKVIKRRQQIKRSTISISDIFFFTKPKAYKKTMANIKTSVFQPVIIEDL